MNPSDRTSRAFARCKMSYASGVEGRPLRLFFRTSPRMHSVRAPRSLCCPAPPCARATLMCSMAYALRLPRACAVRVPPVRSPCMVCVRLILCMPPDARASFVPVRPRAALCASSVHPCALARFLRTPPLRCSAPLSSWCAPVLLCAHRPYTPVPSRVSYARRLCATLRSRALCTCSVRAFPAYMPRRFRLRLFG